MFETATWLEQFRGEPVSVLEGALAAQAWEQRRDDDAGQREADERAQAAEERAEGLHLANRALGNPVGEIASLRSALVGVDDEVAELRERLAKAEARQGRLRENLQWWNERWSLAVDATTTRSAWVDPAQAALMRAQAAAEDARRRGRSVLAKARAQHAGRFRARGLVRVPDDADTRRYEPVCPIDGQVHPDAVRFR